MEIKRLIYTSLLVLLVIFYVSGSAAKVTRLNLIPPTRDYSDELGQYDDSPFGMMIDMNNKDVDLEDVHYLGAKWIRGPMPFLSFQRGLRNKDVYLKRRDLQINIWRRAGLRHFILINPGPKLPEDLTVYSQFVESTVRHYSNPETFGILYFLVHNEPNLIYYLTKKRPDILERKPMLKIHWQDTPEDYAILLRTTYEVAKRANPKVKISLGAVAFGALKGGSYSGFEFFDKVFNFRFSDGRMGKEFIDLIDIHPYGDHKNLLRKVKAFKEFMKKHKLDLPIWSSELGVSSVKRPGIEDLEWHAQEVVKIYVTGISLGIEKMFWTGFKDYRPTGSFKSGKPMQYMGFSYLDGRKKPAFYTYKLMTTILEGSDWAKTKVIHEGKDGLFLYRFVKRNSKREVLVAWWDGSERGGERVLRMAMEGRKARATSAVASETEGKGNIDNVRELFPADTVNIKDGTVDIRLERYPVFVEVAE